MGKALGVERLANDAHPAVHHVRRGHNVGAGPGVGDGLFGQDVQGGVVIYVLGLDDSAVAVVGVFAKAHVGQQQQARHRFLEIGQGALNDAVIGIGVRAEGVLVVGNTEQNDAGDAQIPNLPAFFNRPVNRQLGNARHGTDRIAHPGAGYDEQRHDEVVDAELGFSHHASQRLGTSQAARAVGRKGHAVLL